MVYIFSLRVLLSYLILSYLILSSLTLSDRILPCTVLYSILFYFILFFSSLVYDIISCCITVYCGILKLTTRYHIILSYIAFILHFLTFYFTVLHDITL